MAICFLFALGLSAREIYTCFKIGLAGAGRKYSVITGKIDDTLEDPVCLIFNPDVMFGWRHITIDINSPIDMPPKLLFDPVGLVGDLKIKVGDLRLQIYGCTIQVIGFDRDRVLNCNGLIFPDTPHVSVSLVGGSDVHLVGQFVEGSDGLCLAPGSPLLIIEPKALNSFLRYNLIRTLIFCGMFSFLITSVFSLI